MSLLDKKIVDLTAEEVQGLAKPIGIEGMPYPMVMYKPSDKNGEMVQEIGVIGEIAKSMVVYTEMPMERVQGKLFREMPIPSMLLMLRDLLAKQAPTSKNRIFTVFGDPAFGKSYLFKSVSSIVHPQGAIQVDCGGMNMREIFFRTVIDYGSGVQEVLDKRLAEGKVSQRSIDYMNEEFPGSVVTKDGKSVIDWDRIGARKTGEGGKATEDRGAAMDRGVAVMDKVYAQEKITHLSNSFGIKTVPGEFFEALWSGRPLFLDEFNKSKRGTLDSWQTALQFLNGEEPSVTIYNPMSQSAGDDTMKAITVTRADLKPGFIVGVAGNEGKDGDTTQELSASMMTRLNPMYVGNPTIRDWEHRISQVWTGLPLVTLRNVFSDFAQDKPEEFTEFLLQVRKMGLSPQEVAAIPAKELYFLKNWPETVKAAEQVAQHMDFRFQIANPESALFGKKEYQTLGDEINDVGAKRIAVSFRRVIADHNKAVEGTPEVRPPSKGLVLNIQEAFKNADPSSAGSRAAGWHRFGANLAAAIVEEIINATKDMPKTRAALVADCVTRGILPASFKEAKPSEDAKSLAELLKYDELKDMGGTDELKAVQSVIMAALRAKYPEIRANDSQVIPLENLGRAMQAFSIAAAPAGSAKRVIVPNDDLNEAKAQPLVAAVAISSYNLGEKKKINGVDFRSVLASLAIPDYAEENRQKVWHSDMADVMKRTGQEEDVTPEVMSIIMGNSENGFSLAIASAANTDGDTVYLYVLEDKLRKQTLIVGPEKIPVPLSAALDKNNVTYLLKSDPSTEKKIDDFLSEGSRERHRGGLMTKKDSDNLTENLIFAFARMSEVSQKFMSEDGLQILAGTTFGGLIANAMSKPEFYTQFVKTVPKPRR